MTQYVVDFWFDLQVNVIGDDPYEGEECYTNWGICNSSLASTRHLHVDGSNSKYAKIENEWQLKSIQVPLFVDHSRQCKPYENSKSIWGNDKKVSTVIATNVEGKDKKQSTANEKQQPCPVSMLWLVWCMVGIQNGF